MINLHAVLTPALNICEWLALRSIRFTSEEGGPSIE
jgi:hypothetical protein